MAPIAMFFGCALTALGIVLYAIADPDHRSLTALIPCAFGVVLIVLGVVAGRGSEKTRMHTMHTAALIGLIGLVFPAYRAIAALARGTEVNLAIGGQLAMAALCGLFLALCIKSFIDARRARKQRTVTSEPPV